MRLCGVRGLEPALVAATAVRGGYRTPILPVVISGGGTAGEQSRINKARVSGGGGAAPFLPEGALAAVLKRAPRPCYYRIDRDRLFCREAWQPVAAEVAEAGGEAGSTEGREIVLVVEADSLSSDAPQNLMSSPAKSATLAGVCGGGGGGGAAGDGLSEDQAVWGLAMLRRALEEKRDRDSGRVASVLLAERRLVDVDRASTVSIDGRAALLLSVLTWAQQCAADAVARDVQKHRGAHSRGEDKAARTSEEAPATAVPGSDGADSAAAATRIAEDQAAAVDATADVGGMSTASDAAAEEGRGDAAEAEGPDAPPPAGDEPQAAQGDTNAVANILGVLESMGRGVRVAVAPFGRLQSVVGRSLGSVFAWAKKNGRRTAFAGAAAAATSRVLFYDTDDDESFRWLAAQVLNLSGVGGAIVSPVGRAGYGAHGSVVPLGT